MGGLLGIFSRPATHVAWLLAAVVAAVVAHENLHTSRVHLRPIVEHGPPSAEVYADIGRFVARHARDGETMVIQDAGLAPYVAPSVQVIDFVGLADPQVAAASHDRGLHAFVRALHPERRPEHDAAVRDYLHQRDVEWVVLLSFAIQGIDEVRAAVATGDAEHALAPWMSNETYQVGFYDDRFTDRYQHVRTWARWDRGFLSVFVRADRWPELAASFEITPTSEEPVARWGPARLLAADVASTAITDHELPVRLRWALEPTDRDLRVVLCLIGDNAEWCDPRVPGDGFWPSRTWESTTIEVETLLPLDPDVPAGTYQVAVHVEEAGAALPRDDHTHTNRWVMGEVDVRRWRPLRDPLFTR